MADGNMTEGKMADGRMADGWSRKIALRLSPPTPEDARPLQARILTAIREAVGLGDSLGGEGGAPERDAEPVRIRPAVLQGAGEVLEKSGWTATAVLGYDGGLWELLRLEPGDTSGEHFGLCVDLGSTTILMELVDMNTGEVVDTESIFNPQIAFGEDILTRIFYTKDQPERREELKRAAAGGFAELMRTLSARTGVDAFSCAAMTVAGNTTMIHFLLGLDAFGVFKAPYAVQTLAPDVCRGEELGIPFGGFVYCYPALANYLGGDIISGMIATGIARQEEICVFLDVGTNGELIVGNKDFLLAGAGAAGPALEGGVVRTGMRAGEGAVDRVQTRDGALHVHVIGGGEPKGICGSGIVDLLAELFLNGWIDIRGRIVEEAPFAVRTLEGAAVEYAPGLYFYQSDMEEFLKTKAAAMTMVEYMMSQIGLTMEDVGRFYVAGAFGTHIDKESGVVIGMYPDIEREKIISPGNTSLIGARKMLLDRSNRQEAARILEQMEYVQFGAVEDFIQRMAAARAIPHTDLQRFPSVERKLEERRRKQ